MGSGSICCAELSQIHKSMFLRWKRCNILHLKISAACAINKILIYSLIYYNEMKERWFAGTSRKDALMDDVLAKTKSSNFELLTLVVIDCSVEQ